MNRLNDFFNWIKKLPLWKKLLSMITLIFIGVAANVISHTINNSPDSDSKNQDNIDIPSYPNPHFRLSNYYIRVTNTTYPDLDTVVINYNKVEGMVINPNEITLINSKIKDDVIFYSGSDVEPYSVKLIDCFIKNDSVFLELSRRMIFNGTYAAWFEEEDKRQIGELTFIVPYKIDNEVFRDTLTNRMYLVKKSSIVQ